MSDFIISIFSFLFKWLFPTEIQNIQIRITRLKYSDTQNVEGFVNLYEELFPNNEGDYSAHELLDAVQDPNNDDRHVKADNIILIARYKSIPVGLITCFYYPDKGYGIIGHIGKTKSVMGLDVYLISMKLIKKLQDVLLSERTICKLLLFELKKDIKDNSKARLFSKYANHLYLCPVELDFNYLRPKSNLDDLSGEEEERLFLIPVKNEIKTEYTKSEVLEILEFIHFSCYGDYYTTDSPDFNNFHSYLNQRMLYYNGTLPNIIKAK